MYRGRTHTHTQTNKQDVRKEIINGCKHTLCTHRSYLTVKRKRALINRRGHMERWRQAHMEDEQLTCAGLGVAGSALLQHPLAQVRLLRRRLTGPSPGLYAASTLAAALRPLTPHTPAFWRRTYTEGTALLWWENAVFWTRQFDRVTQQVRPREERFKVSTQPGEKLASWFRHLKTIALVF